MCVQVDAKGLNLVGPVNEDAIGTLIDGFIGKLSGGLFSGGDEDCLFLDLYVPGTAVNSPSTTSLPVVVWFFGGAYREYGIILEPGRLAYAVPQCLVQKITLQLHCHCGCLTMSLSCSFANRDFEVTMLQDLSKNPETTLSLLLGITE